MLDIINIVNDFERSGYSNMTVHENLLRKINLLREGFLELFKINQEISEILSPGFISGYRNIGVEYSRHPSRPDLMKAISLPINYLKTSAGVENHELESLFSSVALDLFQIAEIISSQLRNRYRKAGDPNYLCEDSSFFQVSYYQPVLHKRDTLQDVHEDGNLFTLVWASAPGLEIIKEGFSIPIDFQNPDIYILPGRILSLLTGNKIKACDHVVKRHKNQQDRVSFMCFVNPSVSEPIAPWVVNEYNRGKDIRKETQLHSVKFGLPAITKSA